jgi:hypothetical protein
MTSFPSQGTFSDPRHPPKSAAKIAKTKEAAGNSLMTNHSAVDPLFDFAASR